MRIFSGSINSLFKWLIVKIGFYIKVFLRLSSRVIKFVDTPKFIFLFELSK